VPAPSPAPEPPDPHAAITAAVQGERHEEAQALAARYEEEALSAHGPASEQALHWAEVRADLAMFAGDPVRSCRTWLAVATTRLWARQAPDAPAVENAVDRAHHQWARIEDVEQARELGAELAELRARVPGRRTGALAHVRLRLESLGAPGRAEAEQSEQSEHSEQSEQSEQAESSEEDAAGERAGAAEEEPSVQHAR
jgi:hypothetical protein